MERLCLSLTVSVTAVSFLLLVKAFIKGSALQLRLGVSFRKPDLVVAWRWIRRSPGQKLDGQIADLCYQLSSGLKSGQSMFQAVSDAAENLAPPTGLLLGKVISQFEAGKPLIPTFITECKRVNSPELMQIGRVLSLVDTLGCDPAIALDKTAKAAESRLETRSLLDSKLAEARFSAIIVSLLPLLLGVVSLLSRPDLVKGALQTQIGRFTYLTGAALWVIGTFLVWKLSHPVWA